MILNLGSAIFNAETASGGGTPAWGTEMGQGNGYRFNFEDFQEFITALVYNSVLNPQNRIYCPLGKGGNQAQDYEFVVASLFDKIFVNGEYVKDAKFVLLVTKKLVGANHVGRRTLKYNPRITLDNINYNSRCYDLIANKIGVKSTGSWFISELNVKNQDELHFTAHVLDENFTYTFSDSDDRKKTLVSKIRAYAESKQKNNLKRFAENCIFEYPPQQIYFGAPGTGKSHEIKWAIKTYKSFRITFHPDTDYSSFVGAYKPTSVEVPMLTPLGDKAIPMKDEYGNPLTENKIIYTYVKQAFLNAYIEAWKEQESETPKPVFLVIEEINRGNCAQIFGDVFQLLDRNDAGFSDYSIVPDSDLSRHVKKDLENLNIANKESINEIYKECEADMVDMVLKGELLLLPNNLYIWATMNTSDQSLFPIDSAFKRRWNWKYMPIEYNPIDKVTENPISWTFEINKTLYYWEDFLKKINPEIYDLTESSDKQMGYFFAKADPQTGIISEDVFLNKVMFYLWTDVFKDYDISSEVFKNKKENRSFRFTDFFEDPDALGNFIENLKLEDIEFKDTQTGEEGSLKFKVGEQSPIPQRQLASTALKQFIKKNPDLTAAEVIAEWKPLSMVSHFIETEEKYNNTVAKAPSWAKRAKKVELSNGDAVYISLQGWIPKTSTDLMNAVNAKDWGIDISILSE